MASSPRRRGSTQIGGSEDRCVSWCMASRRSARRSWRRCSNAARTWSRSTWRRRSRARRPTRSRKRRWLRSCPCISPTSYKKPEVWAEFKALKPDLQVMAFVTLFVPEELLNVPTHGSIQYHPSLLPRLPWRQRHQLADHQGREGDRASRSSGPTTVSTPATCFCRRRRRSAPTTRSAPSTSTACSRWASMP